MAGSQEGLQALYNSLESKKDSTQQQIDSLDAEIQKKQEEQDNYKYLMDTISDQLESYTIDSTTSDVYYFHSWNENVNPGSPAGKYYGLLDSTSATDSTSDLISWIIFDVKLDNTDSNPNNNVYDGKPLGYDSTSYPCYDTTSSFFYAIGDYTGITGLIAADVGSGIVYVNIICQTYWEHPTTHVFYTIFKIAVTTGERGQTTNTWGVPTKIFKQHFWIDGGNWSTLTQTKKDQINKYVSDFNYAQDIVFLPLGVDGTYGTKDMLEKLQLGKIVQTANLEKLEAGNTAIGDYV